MHKDPLVKIKDLNKMCKSIGKDVALNYNIPLNKLKEYIRPREVKAIIKQYSVYKNGNYMINLLILKKIFSEINNWILGIQLSKLASDGKLETSWDDEQNCMMFEAIK